jgi:hypothetical protein
MPADPPPPRQAPLQEVLRRAAALAREPAVRVWLLALARGGEPGDSSSPQARRPRAVHAAATR